VRDSACAINHLPCHQYYSSINSQDPKNKNEELKENNHIRKEEILLGFLVLINC